MNDIIQGHMTLLDILAKHRETELIFKSRDKSAGVCLLCTHLFDTVDTVADLYGLDREQLLHDLRKAATHAPSR